MSLSSFVRPNLSGIPGDYVPIVVSDDDDNCGDACVGILATASGNIAVRFLGGETVRVIPIGAGEVRPGLFSRVMATNTTATGLFALQG